MWEVGLWMSKMLEVGPWVSKMWEVGLSRSFVTPPCVAWLDCPAANAITWVIMVTE